jgi:arylsulfatase A-like enzyme
MNAILRLLRNKPELIVLVILACAIGSAFAQPNNQGHPAKPNILWIVANDISPDLGCYGNELIHTPNLDQLAREGVAFENFFTVGAVCSPSRSAFITGMYQVSIHSQNQFTKYKKPLPEPVVPVTAYFKKAGYFVANGGGTNPEKSKHYTGYNFLHDAKEMHDGTDWRQRSEGQPFFAQIHLKHSHRPFQSDLSHPIDPDKVQLPPYYPDHPLARKDWALYLETIQLLDQEVGEILNRLKEDGLADNTVVFFFGDHGRPHVRGKQFLYEGGIHTPLIVRWPGHLKAGTKNARLISNIDLAPAAMALAGIEIPDYMQGRDFLQKSSTPREYVFAMRDRCDGTIDRIRAVRTQDFKYIRNFYPEKPYTQFNGYKKWAYPVLTLMQVMQKNGELTPQQSLFMAADRPAEELYDLRKDPFELNNVANVRGYSKQLKEFRQILGEWLEEADIGKYPENPVEIEHAQEVMKREYKEHMESIGLTADVSDEALLKYWEAQLRETQNQPATR